MESREAEKGIFISLTNDEALVLLDWLARFNEGEHSSMFQDQAEERILFDLESILEKVVPEVFDRDYVEMVAKARSKVRDEVG